MKVIALLTDLFGAVGGIQTFNRSLVQSLDELAVEKNWDVTALVLNDGTGAGRGRPDLVLPKTEYIPFNRRKGAFIAATFRQATATSVVIFGHVNFAPMALGLRIVRPSLKTILAIYGIDVWSRLPILERE
ncbi:MAG TPA: hypothetical protein VJX67_18925, partial [Blastocatellia bacterium]|nr:hypothetical protein [Blastocatellia bacterium]